MQRNCCKSYHSGLWMSAPPTQELRAWRRLHRRPAVSRIRQRGEFSKTGTVLCKRGGYSCEKLPYQTNILATVCLLRATFLPILFHR